MPNSSAKKVAFAAFIGTTIEWNDCDGEYNSRNAVLLLGNSSTNNYKDLIVSYNEQKEIGKKIAKGDVLKR